MDKVADVKNWAAPFLMFELFFILDYYICDSLRNIDFKRYFTFSSDSKGLV